jgi:N-acetylneuraminic acid mutarotase
MVQKAFLIFVYAKFVYAKYQPLIMKTILIAVLVLFSLSLSAQISTNSNWTWVKGDTTRYIKGIYGSKGISSPLNKPGGRGYGNTWTDANGKLWLFGGDGYSRSFSNGYLNDIWKYDPASNQWTWVKGDSVGNAHGTYGTLGVSAAANNPGGRTGSFGWLDPSGQFWVFGGVGSSCCTYDITLNDLWKYNPSTNQWTWVKGNNTSGTPAVYGIKGIASSANNPGVRYQGLSWTDLMGNLWLFGGNGSDINNSSDKLNDLWKYNRSTNQWMWVSGDSVIDMPGRYGTKGVPSSLNKPGARQFGSASWVDISGNLWLFGGSSLDSNGIPGSLNDLWKYNIATNQWTWMSGDTIVCQRGVYGNKGISSPNNKPSARRDAVSWVDPFGNFFLFGGTECGGPSSTNDLWKYDPAINQWTWLKGDSINVQASVYGIQGVPSSSNKPNTREGAKGFFDYSGSIWLFGGYGNDYTGNGGDLNDLWLFGNSSAIRICPPSNTSSLTAYASGTVYQWQISIDNGTTFNNISNNSYYAGVATSTLSLTAIPSSWYGYQYRCVVDGNAGNSFILKSTSVWTGAISTAWENPSNWSCGTVPDAYTDVYINSGAIVVVNSSVTIATLNLNPTASLTINVPFTFTLLGH